MLAHVWGRPTSFIVQNRKNCSYLQQQRRHYVAIPSSYCCCGCRRVHVCFGLTVTAALFAPWQQQRARYAKAWLR